MAAKTPAPVVGQKTENVKVAVRCRPFNKREKGLNAKSVVDIEADGRTIILNDPAKGDKPTEAMKKFTFDHAYDMEYVPTYPITFMRVCLQPLNNLALTCSTQQLSVFKDLAKPIVDQALRGYNHTLVPGIQLLIQQAVMFQFVGCRFRQDILHDGR
jgi:hypothetical protein